MSDLFATEDALQSHNLSDGCVVDFASTTALTEQADVLFASLMAEVAWEQRSVVIAGRSIPQPRLVAWMGEAGLSYTYSGLTLSPSPWTPTLAKIKAVVEELTGTCFNTVLANLYRHGHDSIGFHSDDEPELGPEPTIASVSLGETRRFVLKSKTNHPKQQFEFDLVAGSLLVMRGRTQEVYTHGVPKAAGQMGPRINLTFRNIV